MKSIYILTKRELSTFFSSPLAYITLAVFLLLNGWFFTAPLFIVNTATLDSLFNTIPLIFIVIIPAITMGSVAKEKSTDTVELLVTMPITKTEIIISKFISCLIFVIVGLFFTGVHFATIVALGDNIDYGQIVISYISLVVLAGFYTSIGIFASTLSKNQIIAFLIAFVINFFFFIVTRITLFFPQILGDLFLFLGVEYHLSNMLRGVLDTRDIIYFLSFIILFLRLAQNQLKRI